MKTSFLRRGGAVAGLLLAGFLPSQAQVSTLKVFEDWTTASGTQNTFQRSVVHSRSFSGTTYYYTAGATLNGSGNYDMLVQKLNTAGAVIWSQTYDGPGHGNDVAADVQIDAVGNVYIAGTYYANPTDSNNAIIIKYNAAGTQKWIYTYNGPGSANDGFAALSANNNTVLAVGAAYGGASTLYDFLQVRVDSSGSQQWATTWDYHNLHDGAHNFYISSGAMMVAGGAEGSTTSYDYAVIKVALSNGTVSANNISSGAGIGFNQLTDLKTDASGNVYVTGREYSFSTSSFDFKTMKLDSALSTVWSASYDGGYSLEDGATGLALDAAGNVIVTGYSNTISQGKDFTTIKYDPLGNQMWVANYNGILDDSASCIVASASDTDKIYVSGYSDNGTTRDYYTLRYDGLGNQLWGINYNSIHNVNDLATDIALDTVGAVIVTGQNAIDPTTRTYTTVKYVEKNVIIPPDTAQANPSYLFVENRGQVINTNEQAMPGIRYYNAFTSDPWTYFTDTTVSYVMGKLDTAQATTDTLVRVDLRYTGQKSGRIYSMDETPTYYNFFLPQTMPGGAGRCMTYKQLYYPELYNGLDALYASNIRGLKIYYIGKPGTGGNPTALVHMKWQGADSVRVLGNGALCVYTRMGNIVMPKASAFQINGSGNFVSLAWQPSYNIVATNEVEFSGFGSYNTSQNLVLAMDWGYAAWAPPALYNNLWSTYIQGMSLNDQGYGIDITPNNSKYVTGVTTSGDFPVGPGIVFDPSFNGADDAFCMRFNSSDSLLWCTFLGGFASDVGTDVKLDGANNAILSGYTLSDNFPTFAQTGQYIDNYNIAGDPTDYIFKLGANGFTQMWSTYFGGHDDEYTNWGTHLGLSSTGHIYLAGMTKSLAPSDSFPIRSYTGAYNQTSSGGGAQDGFIARFSPQGAFEWGSYFGGNDIDHVSSLSIDGLDNVYIAGTTYTTSFNTNCAASTNGNFPLCNSGGYFQQTPYGFGDAYITRFDSACVMRWSTLFGGNGQEEASNIQATVHGAYLVGKTSSTTGANLCGPTSNGDFPTCNPGGGATFNANSAGQGDLYIARFSAGDSLIWSTFYGGTGDEEPQNLAYDNAGNLYIGGLTKNNNFPTVQPSANFYTQTNNADASGNTTDPFFMKITASNAVTWATHYGGYTSGAPGLNNETVSALDVWQHDKLYITGIARSLNFPYRCAAPQYCYQTTNSTRLQDAFVAEMDLNGLVGIEPYFQPKPIGFTIYPNPASSQLTIENGDAEMKDVEIKIYNTLGQAVYAQRLSDLAKSGRFTVDVSNLTTGIYVVQLSSPGFSSSLKFNKQ